MNKFYCFLLLLCPLASRSQKHTIIQGVVLSTQQVPIEGANLQFSHSKTIALSKSNGNFEALNILLPDTVVVTAMGYLPKQVFITNRAMLIIQLEPYTHNLAEVTVSTGYQDIPKERASGAFAKVGTELFNRRVSTNVLEHLEGVVPGLVFNRNSYLAANGQLDISIRGLSTILASAQPLIVVDNFPYDGNISNLNPYDIESVTILKDAAAASIWGARSGNGVIVITTKKGKAGMAPVVELSSTVTWGNRPDLFYSPGFISSSAFIDLEKELFTRGYYDADFSNPNRPPVSPVVELLARQRSGLISAAQVDSSIQTFRNYDIRNDVSRYLYRPSFIQQYALNIRGGNSNGLAYTVSLGRDDNRQSTVGNSVVRHTLSSQLTYRWKRLEISMGLFLAQSDSRNNGLANINAGGGNAKTMVPYARLLDDNGKPAAVVHDYRMGYLDTAGSGVFLDWKFYPLNEIQNRDYLTRIQDARMTLGIQYALPYGFSVDVKFQQQTGITANTQYNSAQSYLARSIVNQFSAISGRTVTRPVPYGGVLDKNVSDLNSSRLRIQFNFQRNWKMHSITALAGAEINRIYTSSARHRYYGYDPSIATQIGVDYVNAYKQYITGSSARIMNLDLLGGTDNRYISYFANAGYTYLGRYTLNASSRIDKSNFFGVSANDKAVPLYSVGIAWDMHKETFYHWNALSRLRLRASYGYNANLISNVTAYTTALYYSNSTYYSNLPYAAIISPANNSLRWEKTRVLNLGLEFATRTPWLNGSIDYYFKKGIDLAGDVLLAPSSGFASYTGNNAQIRGQGFELQLNTRHALTQSWRIATHFSLSGAWDQVIQYGVASPANSYILYGSGNTNLFYPLSGHSVYSVYSYRWAGLNSTTGDPQGYLNGKPSTDYTTIFNKTSTDSLLYSGTARPVITGIVRPEISWKHWTLSANLVAKLGYVFRRQSISYAALFTSWSGHRDYYERWQKPGDELTTQVPSLSYPPIASGREQFYSNSEILVEKGDHIRVQDIRLNWRFQPARTNSSVRSLDAFASVNNPGILWRANNKGLDPDLYYNGIPVPISFTIGCILQF